MYTGLSYRLEKIRIIRLLAAVLGLSLLFGCDGHDNDDPPATGSTSGYVRFINLVPDAPKLSAKVNDSLLASASYGQSSGYTQKEVSSTYDLDVFYTDTAGVLQSLLLDQTLNIGSASVTDVLVTGPFAGGTVIQIENPVQDIAADLVLAEIQFVHAGTLTAGSIDVYLTAPGDLLSGATADATLAFQEYSALTQIDSSVDYRIRITAAGTLTVLWDSGTFSLATFSRNLIVALDYFGPGPQIMRAVKMDTTGTSEFTSENLVSGFRFTNTIADSVAVDFYFGSTGGTPVFSNVPFGVTTAYVDLPAGAKSVNVTPVGINTTFLYENNYTLLAGEFRNLVTAGNIADSNISGRLMLEENRRIVTESRLRVVQASSSVGTVDFYLLNPGQIIADATPEFSSLLLLQNGVVSKKGGSYDIVITPQGVQTILLGPQRIDVVDGGIYTIVISDFVGGGTPVEIKLGDDFP